MSSASLNEVRLIGNLGKDPEVRRTEQGGLVAQVSVATRQFRGGEELTEWHQVVLFDRLAELAEQFLRKGASIFVGGRLQTRRWTDGDGVERWTTEVVADTLQFLGSVKREGAQGQAEAEEARAAGGPVPEDDVPF